MTAAEIFAGESDNIEFKEQLPSKSEKYLKTVVAFANGKGGKLVFGVEDKTWKVIGFSKDDVFQILDAVTSAIYDSCEPKIIPDIGVQEIEDKLIIVVNIPAGMQRPYFIEKLGIVNGTYVRVAGTTRHAERYQLQELILDGTNRCFDQQSTDVTVSEEQIAVFCDHLYNQALELCDSDEARNRLQPVSKNQLQSWKLLEQSEGMYLASNGYLLLDGSSNRFPEAVVQCAVFKGTVRNIFITRKEFAGSLYEQIEDAYHFVLQNINLGSRIEGLYRQDIYELPIRSIREMIANAVCHRSYLTPGKIQVALFDDRLEVTSPGMLDGEITLAKMKNGLSKVRNKGIAAAFSYMNIIEAWGSGIPRLFREANEYGLQEPELIDMGSDFRVNLFRRAMDVDSQGIIDPTTQDSKPDTIDTIDTNRDTIDTIRDTIDTNRDTIDTAITDEEKLIAIIREVPTITQQQMQVKTGLSLSTIKRLMAGLQKRGTIVRVGNNRSGKWEIKE